MTGMRAMVLGEPGQPMQLQQLPIPEPEAGQLLLKVRACGVCRTDLHVVDGELTEPSLPLIPGHQIVAEVVTMGSAMSSSGCANVRFMTGSFQIEVQMSNS